MFICATQLSVAAQEMSPEVRQLGKQAMDRIISELYSLQEQHSILSQIDQLAVGENAEGYPAFQYNFKKEILEKEVSYYQLALTFGAMDAKKIVDQNVTVIQKKFPLIGIKFFGYEWSKRSAQTFDFERVLDEALIPLERYQQAFLPYQIRIIPEKESFKTNEEISFFIELHNKVQYVLRLKKPTTANVSIYYDEELLLSEGDQKEEYIVLEPGEVERVTFKLGRQSAIAEHAIRCVYLVAYEGVIPFAEATINIVE